MQLRLKLLLSGSKQNLFVSILVLSFLWKLLFSWRSGIERGWQDELSWANLALTTGFLGTVTTYDSGYPTPFLRAISFFLSTSIPGNFLVWHLFVLFLISLSIASLAFSRIISRNSAALLAALLTTYPSFDLLLLHNLSYWTFIPLMVILTNIMWETKKVSFPEVLKILFLVMITAKPQILLSLLILTAAIVLSRKMLKSYFIVVPVFVLIYFAFGRLTSTSITLSFDGYSAVNYFLTVSSHFLSVVLPLGVLSAYSVTRYFDLNLVLMFFLLSNLLVIYVVFSKKRQFNKSNLFIGVLLTFLTYTLGLYFFSNSGWSQNDLIFSDIYTSLFSRHYLPIVLCAAFALVLGSNDHRFFRGVIGVAVIQNGLMQIALFSQLYSPA